MSYSIIVLRNLNNYEGESHTQEETKAEEETERALKSGSLWGGTGLASLSPRGAPPSGGAPGGGWLKSGALTELKKTPPESKLKSPVRTGKRSVPRRTRSGNMVMRQAMRGVAEDLMKTSSESLVIELVGAQFSPMRRRRWRNPLEKLGRGPITQHRTRRRLVEGDLARGSHGGLRPIGGDSTGQWEEGGPAVLCLTLRKAEGLGHGRFSSLISREATILHILGNTYENDDIIYESFDDRKLDN